jgi:hypothetical protein
VEVVGCNSASVLDRSNDPVPACSNEGVLACSNERVLACGNEGVLACSNSAAIAWWYGWSASLHA